MKIMGKKHLRDRHKFKLLRCQFANSHIFPIVIYFTNLYIYLYSNKSILKIQLYNKYFEKKLINLWFVFIHVKSINIL